jgi:hypothetical protein
MFFYIIAVLVVVIVTAIAAGKWWQRYAEDRRVYNNDVRTIKGWINAINNAKTPHEAADVGSFSYADLMHRDTPSAICAIDGYAEASKRLEQAWNAKEYLEADMVGQLKLLRNFLGDYPAFPTQFNIGFTKSDIPQMINDRVAELRIGAEQGSVDEVLQFNVVLQLGDWAWLTMYGVEPLVCPDNWNEKVAQHFKAPSIKTFDGFTSDPQPGTVRLLAVRALRERSLVLGKVVLAYCDIRRGKDHLPHYPYHQEVGDVLLAELAKMVDAIHVERKLFV